MRTREDRAKRREGRGRGEGEGGGGGMGWGWVSIWQSADVYESGTTASL